MKPDTIEYSFPEGAVLRFETAIVPRKGEAVSIGGKTYMVAFVSYAVDHYKDRLERQHVACVQLENHR